MILVVLFPIFLAVRFAIFIGFVIWL